MQAVFIFAMMTLFLAVVNSMIHSGSDSAIQLKDRHIAAVQVYFKEVENIMNHRLIPEDMAVPDLGDDVGDYLSHDAVLEQANWNISSSTTEDPWGRDFTGFVVHQRVNIRSQAGGGVVTVPITGFVLVSSGPDRTIDPALQASLDDLNATSEVRDIMNIEATADTDDIVRSFSTAQALNRKWKEVEERVFKLAITALKLYIEDMDKFYKALYEAYTPIDVIAFFDVNGALIINPANIADWTGQGVPPPPQMILYETLDNIGEAGAVKYIEDSDLRIRLKAYDSTSGVGNANCTSASATYGDSLRVCISNNGSPWGNNSGTLLYYTDAEGGSF